MHYQILKAPAGNLLLLEEVVCNNYTVLVAGGNFELIIDSGINPGDVFYLRIYEPSGVISNLLTLLNGSTVTMQSSAGSTLSTPEVRSEHLAIVQSNSELKLINNEVYSKYEVIDISGNALISKELLSYVTTVDVSNLSKGMYLLRLKDANSQQLHKFIK